MLNKLGIFTQRDLIDFFPRGYEDWTSTGTAAMIRHEETGTFVAVVDSSPVLRYKGKMSILKVTLRDADGERIFATWFNQPYYQDRLQTGNTYLFRGKIKRSGIIAEIVNPVFEPAENDERVPIKPVYPLTSGLTQGVIRNLVRKALDSELPKIEDCLPDWIRKHYKLCSAAYAYEKIHLPGDAQEFLIARRRLAFEELFMIQAGLKLIKTTIARKAKAIPVSYDHVRMKMFYDSLPFVLTDSQREVIDEILADISSEVPMNRLIQGDVGSGKTVISAAAVAACINSGHQAVLMVPTSVLANQHFKTFTKYFSDDPSKIELLTGSITGKRRKEIFGRLLNEIGRAHV